MNQLTYEVEEKKKFTRFILQPITIQKIAVPNEIMDKPVARVEDYYEVEYPVRTAYLNSNDVTKIPYPSGEFATIYTPFERERIDHSSFISTPHKVAAYAKTMMDIEEAGLYNFNIRTCGAVKIWANGQERLIFAPYTRNHGSDHLFSMSLEKGSNEIVVYFEDLAERDVTFYFELQNENTTTIHGHIDTSLDMTEYRQMESLLYGAYLEKDTFKEGAIRLNFSQPLEVGEVTLRLRINPSLSLVDDGAQDGNITDFEITDTFFTVYAGQKELTLGLVEEIPTAGLTRFELGLALKNQSWITRTLTGSIYPEASFGRLVTEETIEGRKQAALNYYATLELEDINVGLVKAFLGQAKETDFYQAYLSAFRLIEEKGDCADFVLAPLMGVYTKENEQFPDDFHARMKELAIGFRYWIDEPGNDVMWYFSENHALLFHVSQYLAGHLYPDATFVVSGRKGREQYKIGKQRLLRWFEQFFAVGFSEWNSTTYFPIDFIGFFSLYLSAPDKEIRDVVKKALDYTFHLMAINYHGGTMTSTFGRVYEHNLKAMQLGEISSVIQLAWNKGYFNNSLRASALFAMTDYEPPKEYAALLNLDAKTALHAEYEQGDNKGYTYLYKTADYSLASTIAYRPYQAGHQQHITNISLGDCTILWLSNPGEAEFSGENRPSFWAGNGSMPFVNQYKNLLFAHYNLTDAEFNFVHLYLPFWDLDEIIEEQNYVYIRKGAVYAGIFFSNPVSRTYESAIYGREIRSVGENQLVVVKLGSISEGIDFQTFKQNFSKRQVSCDETGVTYVDPSKGTFSFTPEGLKRENQPIRYTQGYDLWVEQTGVEP